MNEGYEPSADELRRQGHRIVEDLIEILAAERRDPVLQPTTGEAVRELFDEPLPERGSNLDEVLDQALPGILRHSRRNGHPRFFGYVCASADPVGVFADALISALNQNVTAWRSGPAATEIERLVVRWLTTAVGFGGEGHGLLTSGGSAANAGGIACALAAAEATRPSTGRSGLPSASRGGLRLYRSAEAHISIRVAARQAGLGDDQVVTVGVDAQRRLDPDDLDRRLRADRAAGHLPACVCASAGTANAGTVDPLPEIAEICRRHGVWLHIDGAYGAPAALVDGYGELCRGFAAADSLSLDPHKWLFAPLDVGCLLVRDATASRRAFGQDSEYIAVHQTEPLERFAFFDHGPELSRRFRALKVWLILKVRGRAAIAGVIGRNLELRRHLDARVDTEPELELLASGLSISCFRYRPPSTDGELDTLNREILESLVAEGRVYMSPTVLDGRYSLRVAIVNFRTRRADIDFLVDEVLRRGRELAGSPDRDR